MDLETPHTRKIAWAGGTEELLTAAGETLKLKGTGPELYNWAPQSKKALDVELRIQPVAGNAQTAQLAVWRYAIEITHADGIYRFPGQGPGAPLGAFIVPHRGLVARLSAKEVRVTTWFETFIGDPPDAPPALTLMQVSIEPALGSNLRPQIIPNELNIAASPGAKRFPAEATQWRVRDLTGQPIALGIIDTFFLSISGPPVSVVATDAALLFDWTPIPPLAAFWGATGPCMAEYR